MTNTHDGGVEPPRGHGKCEQCGARPRKGCKVQTSQVDLEEAANLPGAPLSVGYHHIRSLGGRGRVARKSTKDAGDSDIGPQPLYIESSHKRGNDSWTKSALTDGPGWAVLDSKPDGIITMRLLGGEPCIVSLEDGTEVIGVDDFGYYSARRGRTEWRLVEADSEEFKYQTPPGEALKVYRIVNAAHPTHGWIYKQYEGAHLIGYGDVYSPQNGFTDPEYARDRKSVV